jgi:hypothetical protein
VDLAGKLLAWQIERLLQREILFDVIRIGWGSAEWKNSSSAAAVFFQRPSQRERWHKLGTVKIHASLKSIFWIIYIRCLKALDEMNKKYAWIESFTSEKS